MAKQTLTKVYYSKDKETGKSIKHETVYRIDPDFTPKAIGDICAEFIDNFMETRPDEDKEWLGALVSEDVNGKPPSFFVIRSRFAERFFPAVMDAPKKTAKKETWAEKWRAKYGKKAE